MNTLRHSIMFGLVGAVTLALYVGAPPTDVQADTGNVAQLRHCVAQARVSSDAAVADRASDQCLQDFALAAGLQTQ